MREANNELKLRLAVIEADLEKVNHKFLGLSLREAMRSLEKYCVLEVIGHARMVDDGIYAWDQLKPLLPIDASLKQKMDEVLKGNSLTIDHLSALTFSRRKATALFMTSMLL